MIIDVICLTNTTDEHSFGMTKRTLDFLTYSETTHKFNIILIESNSNSDFIYPHISHYIKPNIPFNYNKYLNIANDYLKSDWVLITNNDVRYEKNWLTEILKVHDNNPDIESFSPKELLWYSTLYSNHFNSENQSEYWINYKVSEGLFGWSLLMKRRVWNEVYPWDEDFDFYYQDNDYAKIIEQKGIKHALVRNSLTLHLGNLSFFKNELDPIKDKKMEEDYQKFIKKWNNI